MITVEQLIACGVGPTQAKVFAPALGPVMAKFDIALPLQKAGFIAQCMHESTNFTRMEESTYYSKPEFITNAFIRMRGKPLAELEALCRQPQKLANTVYANINGNGPFESGDGWRHRGRGPFQLTGRANYAAASKACGRDYLAFPELVAQPEDGCLVAAWFWTEFKGCNRLIVSRGFDATSVLINGGDNGKVDRQKKFVICREVIL